MAPPPWSEVRAQAGGVCPENGALCGQCGRSQHGVQRGGADVPLSTGGSTLPTTLLLITLLGLALALGLCCTRRTGLHKRLFQLSKGTSCQYR